MVSINQKIIAGQEQQAEFLTDPNADKSLEDRLPFASLLLIVSEFSLLIMAGFVADWLYHWVVLSENPSDIWLLNSVSTATIFVLLQTIAGKYATSWILKNAAHRSNLMRDWLLTIFIVLIFSFLSKQTSDQSRGAYILFSLLGILSLNSFRKLVYSALSSAIKKSNFIVRNIILIGQRDQVERYYTNENLWKKGIRVAASLILDPKSPKSPVELWINHNQLQLSLPNLDRATVHLRHVQADDIVLAVPWAATSATESILKCINVLPCAIYLAPDPAMAYLKSSLGGQSSLSQALTDSQTGLSGIRIAQRPLTPMARLAKRSFDIVVSGLGLMVLSPILLLIAILVRLETPGSPIYRQQRNGFNERPFNIYKFRSMVFSKSTGFSQTQKNDARITKMGTFIRRTNLDELPQLINVFVGSMSLVGPRPHAIAHNNEFMTQIAHYAGRHHVKPGITGWAQINGWRGAAESQTQMSGRVAHDLEYIRNWSFALDLKILFNTVFSKKAFHNAF